jgi:endogenous inhibitor of DNA gyrase (YacG/DUF329 family)
MGISESVIAIRKANPCATLQTIGNQVGVSRERVRHLLNDAHLPTTHFKQKYLCVVCGSEIEERDRRQRHSPFCSNECSHKYHNVTLSCDFCGKSFERNVSDTLMYHCRPNKKQVGIFCSRKCFGKWAGKTYGFVAHPENCNRDGYPPKYDYSKIDQLHLEGLSYAEIGHRLNIPLRSIYMHNYQQKRRTP